jgi:outer membrane biosynthesis protein TonB
VKLLKTFLIVWVLTPGVFAMNMDSFVCSKANETGVREHFEKSGERQKLIAECEEKTEPNRIKESGAPSVKISGDCEWSNDGCPVRLIKPTFPTLAKALKIYGQVPVRAIIDETGKVIFARVLGGHPLFRLPARKAACQSFFYPRAVCGQKIAQSRIIVYNFVK